MILKVGAVILLLFFALIGIWLDMNYEFRPEVFSADWWCVFGGNTIIAVVGVILMLWI